MQEAGPGTISYMAERAVTTLEGIRYGWHDRYRIPLDHPSALPFYLENLIVPHSRREVLWVTIARSSALAGRLALPLLGAAAASKFRGEGAGVTAGGAAEEGVTSFAVTSLGVRGDRLKECLRGAGVALEGEPAVITLDDYQHSERRKRILFVFGRGAKTPCAVVKASPNPEHRASLEHEFGVMRSLRERLGPEVAVTVPEPLALFDVDGVTVFAESYLGGRSMYFEMRNGWFPRRRVREHFRLARRWLVEFQKATAAGEARLGDEALGEFVTGPLRDYRRLCARTQAEREWAALAAKLARDLKGERVLLAGRQGDFWARNLLVKGDSLGVVDWEGFRERSTPFYDLFLFAASYGLSYPWRLGRWAEPSVAFNATFREGGWMSGVVREYLHAYCDSAGVSPRLLELFFYVFLAERALDESAREARGDADGAQTTAPGKKKGQRPDAGIWGRLARECAGWGGPPHFAAG